MAAKAVAGIEGELAKERLIVLILPTVSGAPGDGNSSLAAAIKRALPRNGVAFAEFPTAYTSRADVVVRVGEAHEGKQSIRIEWVVKLPQNKRLTVVQKNDIPAGSLEGEWGRVADDVARAGVSAMVQELLLQRKR